MSWEADLYQLYHLVPLPFGFWLDIPVKIPAGDQKVRGKWIHCTPLRCLELAAFLSLKSDLLSGGPLYITNHYSSCPSGLGMVMSLVVVRSSETVHSSLFFIPYSVCIFVSSSLGELSFSNCQDWVCYFFLFPARTEWMILFSRNQSCHQSLYLQALLPISVIESLYKMKIF